MLETLGFWSRLIDAIGRFGGDPVDLFAPWNQNGWHRF